MEIGPSQASERLRSLQTPEDFERGAVKGEHFLGSAGPTIAMRVPLALPELEKARSSFLLPDVSPGRCCYLDPGKTVSSPG